MTASPRPGRHARSLEGPLVATVDDIPQLNELFAEAFTERYRKDGMTGVRVPPLNPAIWRYAIEGAGDGALCWRDERGRLAAFNIVHHSGTEGWMGPLCVRPDCQGAGLGKIIVDSGLRWLRQQSVTVIGLETMPRTLDNIGFYSNLGFVPGHLTVTMTLDAALGERAPTLLSALSSREKEAAVAACRDLTMRVMPGYDFTREFELTDQHGLGDTLVASVLLACEAPVLVAPAMNTAMLTAESSVAAITSLQPSRSCSKKSRCSIWCWRSFSNCCNSGTISGATSRMRASARSNICTLRKAT